MKPTQHLINLLKMNNFTKMNCSSIVSTVNNETNPDLVWSEISKVWMSKKEFAKTETLNNAYSPIKIYNIKINIMSDDNSKEKNIILFLKENFKINLVRK